MTRAEIARSEAQLTLLVVDDHDAFRSFARQLGSAAGFAVTGEAADGRSALTAAEALRPDVVLLDIQLPDIDGIEVARRLAEQTDPPTVVLTSTRDEAEFGSRLSTSQAAGFIPKAELSADRLATLVKNPGP